MRTGGRDLRSTAALIVVVGVAMTLVAVAATGSAARRYRVRTDRIGPGVTMMKILDRRGPNRIRVLKIDPSGPITLDVALATDELPGHETTTSMARRHGALAAINGDFTLLPGSPGSGRPVNTFIEDGHLKASPLIWGRNFSITREETSARVGHTRLRSWVTLPSGERWTMTGTNPLEPADGFTMYTPAGGKLFAPPRRSCAARLLASGAFGWNGDMNGVSRDFVVDEVVCRRRPLKRFGGNVVAAPLGSPEAAQIEAALVAGYEVGYGWAFNRTRMLDTIGGNPDLMDGGRVVGGECEGSYFCDRNPRTGVGITPSGKILLVTVDGRSRRSRGMTLEEFGGLFRYLGAESAMNLDGGGSTTMVVRGRIVNVPSGGYERPVGSALLVLPGADGGEAEPGPYVTPSPFPTVSPVPTPGTGLARALAPDGIQAAVNPACAYLTDPGSTGGMLDALAKGQLGHVDRLPDSLRTALRIFRGSADCR